MSFICIVCRDLITPPGTGNNDNNAEMVATACGHLHHLNCLNEWFNTREHPRLECPCCKTKVVQAELRRIFPSGDEETDDIVNRYQDAQVQRGANRQLQEEIDEKVGQLVEMQGKLEDEKFAHDCLRYDHSKLIEDVKVKVTAKIVQLQVEANEEKQIMVQQNEIMKTQLTAVTNQLTQAEIVANELKGKVEDLTDLVEALKQQRFSLRKLLAEKEENLPNSGRNGELRGISGVQDADAAMVELCIQFLRKIKPTLPGAEELSPGDNLRQIAYQLDQTLAEAQVPQIKKEVEEHEVIDLVSFIKSEPEDNQDQDVNESGESEARNTSSDENTCTESEKGVSSADTSGNENEKGAESANAPGSEIDNIPEAEAEDNSEASASSDISDIAIASAEDEVNWTNSETMLSSPRPKSSSTFIAGKSSEQHQPKENGIVMMATADGQ